MVRITLLVAFAVLACSRAPDTGIANDASTDTDADDAGDSGHADGGNDSTTDDSGVIVGAACTAWNVTNIFPTPTTTGITNAGFASSLAFSGADAHVAFSTNLGLHYGTNAGGTWSFVHVSPVATITATAIAVHAGKVHITFYGGPDYQLWYATNASGSWIVSHVDTGRHTGQNHSLRIDASGQLHVAYLDSTMTALKYARLTSTGWQSEVLDPNIEGLIHPSLLLDSVGRPIIAYSYYSIGMFVGSDVGGTWARTTIDPGLDVGGWNSLGRDEAGILHASYRRYKASGSELRYATNAGGVWTIEPIDTTGNPFSTSLVVGGGVVHVAYLNGGATKLTYAARTQTGWVTQPVSDAYSIADGTSIAFDGTGRPAITFRAYGGLSLAYAKCVD